MEKKMSNNFEEKLAVLILNYNSSELTLKNVNQIRKLSEYIRIVVVDNCSTDNSVDILKEATRKINRTYIVANTQNTGYAAGNNFGIKYIESNFETVDTILISNPDIIVPHIEILRDMYYILNIDSSIGAITVQTIYNNNIFQPNECCWKDFSLKRLVLMSSIVAGRWIGHKRYSKYSLNKNGVSYVDIVQGCFFMIKINTLMEIGYFDQNTFLYGEELILSKKLKQKKYRNAVMPQYYIYHNHQEKDKSLIAYEKKKFDMKCFFDSRKYYVKNYMETSDIKKKIACIVFDIDYAIKKFLFKLKSNLK